MMKKPRTINKVINGLPASDGDGVQLTRIIGSPYLNQLDPFLLFDQFGSEQPQDYIGGFPSHPHRGFETVTYMLAGKMRHKDSANNEGMIEAGGVQWMTAGKGIIHSEMPEQEKGLLAGFQLWVNLPAAHKMTTPRYQEFHAQNIPIEDRGDIGYLKVIAGITDNGTTGVIDNTFVEPVYWDIYLNKGATFVDKLPVEHNAFIYVIDGQLEFTTSPDKPDAIDKKPTFLSARQLAVLSHGDTIQFKSTENSRCLLIAGKPLNEPIERAGPFVMNTREEINQAFSDYQSGKLA